MNKLIYKLNCFEFGHFLATVWQLNFEPFCILNCLINCPKENTAFDIELQMMLLIHTFTNPELNRISAGVYKTVTSQDPNQ